MKAITYEKYGELKLDDVPVPELTDDRVLIRVRATGLNPFDWHLYRGDPYLVRMQGGWRAPKEKHILGADVAGEVVSVGANVTDLKPGDRVFGEVGHGGCAEFVAARRAYITKLPDTVSFETGAATPMGAITALQGLRRAGVAAGHSVLVNGASGGVGHMAVQIARALGATSVAAVCSTANVEMMRSLGADTVIDYTRDNFTRLGARYDVIFDTVGTHGLTALRRALVPGGTFITVGSLGGGKLLGPARYMAAIVIAGKFVRERVETLLDTDGTPADFELLAQWLDAGTIRPVIQQVFPLEQTFAAMEVLEGGHVAGKLVVRAKESLDP
jgi:NADPH:quinone reductase-like Zn-dependent oxidoreductase